MTVKSFGYDLMKLSSLCNYHITDHVKSWFLIYCDDYHMIHWYQTDSIKDFEIQSNNELSDNFKRITHLLFAIKI